MPDIVATMPESTPSRVPAEGGGTVDRLRWFEVSLVLAIGFSRPLLNSLYIWVYGLATAPHFTNFQWFLSETQMVLALVLLGYTLRRRNQTFRNLGLSWSLKEFGAGLLLAVAAYIAYWQGYRLVGFAHNMIYGSPVTVQTGAHFFGHPTLASIPFFLLGPFFEEMIVRAYLMTEILELTGSSALAVTASVVLQSAYHLYYGWAGVLSLSLLFLTLAFYYIRYRRALPVIVAHEVIDIFAVIRLL